MAIQYKTNSYVTLDEANAYFADRSNASGWLALNNNQKEDYLITATNYLDDVVEFTGIARSTSQPLAWPRAGSYFEPKYGATMELPTTDVPSRVKKATHEMALHLIENPGILSSKTTLDHLQVGTINLSDVRKPSRLPHTVRKALGPLQGSTGTAPWRAW